MSKVATMLAGSFTGTWWPQMGARTGPEASWEQEQSIIPPARQNTTLVSLHKPVDGQVCLLHPEAEALLLLLQAIPVH